MESKNLKKLESIFIDIINEPLDLKYVKNQCENNPILLKNKIQKLKNNNFFNFELCTDIVDHTLQSNNILHSLSGVKSIDTCKSACLDIRFNGNKMYESTCIEKCKEHCIVRDHSGNCVTTCDQDDSCRSLCETEIISTKPSTCSM